jgi:hypothetical protein
MLREGGRRLASVEGRAKQASIWRVALQDERKKEEKVRSIEQDAKVVVWGEMKVQDTYKPLERQQQAWDPL